MGNNDNVSIRFNQTGDDENIVELLKKTFPKWRKFGDPLKLWRWKYIDTPQRSIVTVAVADNKIVGCSHQIIFNAKLGSEITSLLYGDDLAVDVDYRGFGIWNKMRYYREQKFGNLTKYNYSTTTNPIVLESWVNRNRAMLPFPVTRMVKIHDIDLQLRMRPMKNGLLVKFCYYFLKNLNRITNLFRPPINRSDESKITEISKFDEGIDTFWEKIKDDYNFILEKKHTYLNWRFRDTERGNHILMQAMKGEEILGYAVIGLREDEGYTEGQIVDLIALKNRLDVADALLDYACKYFDDHGINTVYYEIVEDHPYQNLSKRKGFINSRSRTNISFDYTEYWKKSERVREVPFLKHTAPSQVYFNYAETV